MSSEEISTPPRIENEENESSQEGTRMPASTSPSPGPTERKMAPPSPVIPPKKQKATPADPPSLMSSSSLQASRDNGEIPAVERSQCQRDITIVIFVNPDNTETPFVEFGKNYQDGATCWRETVNLDENGFVNVADLAKALDRIYEDQQWEQFGLLPETNVEDRERTKEGEEDANTKESTGEASNVSKFHQYNPCLCLYQVGKAFREGIRWPDSDQALIGKLVKEVGRNLNIDTTEKIEIPELPGSNRHALFACYSPGMDEIAKRRAREAQVPDIEPQERAESALLRLYADLRNTLGLVLDESSTLIAPCAVEYRRDGDVKYIVEIGDSTPSLSRSPSRASISSLDQESTSEKQVLLQPYHSSTTPNFAILQDFCARVLNGRSIPGSQESPFGLDIALYNSTFARFRALQAQYKEEVYKELESRRAAYRLEPVPIKVEDLKFHLILRDLTQELIKLCPSDKRNRKAKIWGLLEVLLGVDTDDLVEVHLRTGSQPDLVDLDVELSTCTVVFNFNAENVALGLVHIQAQMSYLATQRAFCQRYDNTKTCAPAFIISLVGRSLWISGAVLPSRMICAQLYGGEDDLADPARLGATFRALQESIADLRRMYAQVPHLGIQECDYAACSMADTDVEQMAHPRFFPWPRSFLIKNISGALRRVPFKYLYPLQRREPYNVFAVIVDETITPNNDPHPTWDEKYRAIDYADKTEMAHLSGRKLVVRFAKYYGYSCHNFAADHGFAPKLHSCRRFEMTGAFAGRFIIMAVMDFIEGTRLQPRHYMDEALHLESKLEEKVRLLHDNSYVHGDLRSQNIMVVKDKEEKIQLVDFSVAIYNPPDSSKTYRYPPSWPDKLLQAGQVQNGVIDKQVDLSMLKRMFRV